MRGATVVDTVMTLPPSGRSSGSNSNNQANSPSYTGSPISSSTASGGSHTIHAFGTMPRRGQNRQQNNNPASSPPPLETHFDQPQSCDDEEWSATDGFSNRKISNAHSGSAPSLVAAGNEGAHDGGEKVGFAPVSTTASNGGSNAFKSVPRSARHQSVERALVSHGHNNDRQQQQQQQPIATKPKGLRKFLGRMRRSSSGTIHDDKKEAQGSAEGGDSGHLKRGGFRASAGSRFASWMGPNSGLPPTGPSSSSNGSTSYPADPNLPFRQWKAETICSWLDHLGLYMYSGEVRRHVKTGEQLLALSSHDLEHKLGMKSGLHRKKVLLALQAKQNGGGGSQHDLPGKLDHQWVVRWLDDVGLPQYKDAFLEARVDGRVLNFLTVEDLFQMRVTNLLHHLSIRRGIQVDGNLNVHFSVQLERQRNRPLSLQPDSSPERLRALVPAPSRHQPR